MGGKVIVGRDGGVATVTLSNPAKKNALNLKILNELRAALVRLSGEDTRCLILRGEGSEAFCAGYDITRIPAGGSGEAQVLLSSNPFDDMIRAIESFPSPVVAMLNGFAFGGGLEMAVACDIRVASDQGTNDSQGLLVKRRLISMGIHRIEKNCVKGIGCVLQVLPGVFLHQL